MVSSCSYAQEDRVLHHPGRQQLAPTASRKNWPGAPESKLLPTPAASALWQAHSCRNAGELSQAHQARQTDHPKCRPISSGAIQRPKGSPPPAFSCTWTQRHRARPVLGPEMQMCRAVAMSCAFPVRLGTPFPFATCACSHAAQSCADCQPWHGGRPRSGSPASAASPAVPSCSKPGVPRWADGRKTGATPQSSWPSISAGLRHCGETRRAGRAAGQTGRKGPRLQSGSPGCRIRWRSLLQSRQRAAGSEERTSGVFLLPQRPEGGCLERKPGKGQPGARRHGRPSGGVQEPAILPGLSGLEETPSGKTEQGEKNKVSKLFKETFF